jgi:tRNA U34 5-carboxymethylaminomethyl modifying GTPase MnmE/TrmE
LPETTRDIVEETVRLGDIVLRLSDTAGIRETEDIVEGVGVERANRKLETAELILAVFDNSDELSTEDIELVEKMPRQECCCCHKQKRICSQSLTEIISTAFSVCDRNRSL